MTGASSLPPLKKNDGKYGLLALLLLLLAGGLWFFLRGEDDPNGRVEEAAPAAEPVPRQELVAELEIPEEEEPADAEPVAAPPRPRGHGGGDGTWTRPEDWVCTGSIDARRVGAVIRGAPSKQVQTCYERGLKGNNLLQGSMEVELTIDGSGRVRAVSVGGTLADRQVYSCVKRVARSWQFPRPTGGCVRINAPFQMTPKL